MKQKTPVRLPYKPKLTVRDRFQHFSRATSEIVGSVWAFLTAIFVVVVWLVTGPLFGYSDTWQLIINTGTTVITFMMVFLIQSTQNRDAKAVHLKLDELLRATDRARDELVDLEDLSENQLDALAAYFARLHKQAMAANHKGKNSHAGPRTRATAAGTGRKSPSK